MTLSLKAPGFNLYCDILANFVFKFNLYPLQRGLAATELVTERLAWHGLRNVTVLQVELMKQEIEG